MVRIGAQDVEGLSDSHQRLALANLAPRNLSPNEVVVLASQAVALAALAAHTAQRLTLGAFRPIGFNALVEVPGDMEGLTVFAPPQERHRLTDWSNFGPLLVGVVQSAGFVVVLLVFFLHGFRLSSLWTGGQT